ncbi:MAG: indole-3-glycerol phosphate synthase TrpC [Bacillota bacterium]|nr:indole-3-glycerol phosphate synthase TrpC [Bacillota bacterium]
METILERILKVKKTEIKYLKENQEGFSKEMLPKRSLLNKLEKAKEISVIAEFKRSSPSKGIINHSIDPVEQAKQYEENGAAAISVLTDESFFNGSIHDLIAVKKAVNVPVLCKDFIIDYVQIDLAARCGADIVLLIVAALDEMRLIELYQYAKSKGLEVLIEVHHSQELDMALKSGAKLIGINNRNLKTFQVSLSATELLGPIVKKSGAFLVSESGIHNQQDVERVRNAGANGILVGEALMKSANLKQHLEGFQIPLVGDGCK